MTAPTHVEHKAQAKKVARVWVLTISDTRTEATDVGGKLARELISEAGHTVAGHGIVKDEPEAVQQLIQTLIESRAAEVLITTGGTGISSRDSTYEAVSALLEKRLDGFGELFRMLSYAEVGSAAMLSRAVAGLYRGLVIFALPGSPNAVGLGLKKLIIPELGHLRFEANR